MFRMLSGSRGRREEEEEFREEPEEAVDEDRELEGLDPRALDDDARRFRLENGGIVRRGSNLESEITC